MWWWALVALELVAPHPNLSSKAGLWLRSWLSVIPSDTRNWLREVAQGTGELSYGSLLHLPSISPLQLNFSPYLYILFFSCSVFFFLSHWFILFIFLYLFPCFIYCSLFIYLIPHSLMTMRIRSFPPSPSPPLPSLPPFLPCVYGGFYLFIFIFRNRE